MANNLLKLYSTFIKPSKTSLLFQNRFMYNVNNQSFNIPVKIPIISPRRQTSFFNKYSADALWKSVTSVSNAGRQRGRGRGAKRAMKNLNLGQQIGVGKVNMLWPGLTGPIMQGTTVLKQQRLPDDPDREKKLIELRDAKKKFSFKQHPLERGWTGGKMGGRSLGPPDPVNDDTFEGFETKIIEHKMVSHMTGNLGRRRSHSVFVITGNSNGLCGIALGKSQELKAALRLAKNRAGFKLMYVPLYNDHTVFHDFFSQFGKTKLFVTKKPEGYGLICHRAIKSACEVIGIKDIHCKIEGAINVQSILKAFLLGLLKQKSHQQMAEDKKLHLVEMRKENLNYPTVIASPSVVRKPEEIKSTEIMDFTQYALDGKVVLRKKKFPPFYTKMSSYSQHLRKREYLRNQNEVRLRLIAEYGELKSFLSDQYPEAKPFKKEKVKNAEM